MDVIEMLRTTLENLHQLKMMDYAEAFSDLEKARINGYLDAIDDVAEFVRDCEE